MTVATLFLTEAGPILFGDVMLSRPGVNPRILLPTIGEVTDALCPPGTDAPPAGLGTKLCIVRPNLAVAWAGNFETADELVRRLLPVDPSDDDELKRVIAYVADSDPSTDMIVVSADSRGYGILTAGEFERWTPRQRGFADARSAGSGAAFFRAHFENYRESSANSDTPGTLEAVLALQSMMSKAELLMPTQTVGANFGGAWETIGFRNGAFEHVDEAAMLFWAGKFRMDDSGAFSFRNLHFYRAMRMTHYYGAPLVRVLKIRGAEVEAEQLHVIDPLPAIASRVPEWPPPESAWPRFDTAEPMINVFAFQEEVSGDVVVVNSIASRDACVRISVSADGREHRFDVREAFVNEVARATMESWRLSQQG